MSESVERVIEQTERFLRHAARKKTSFFNEAELQHELGFWLRRKLPSGSRVYFERPASSFFSNAVGLAKKEIDLAVVPPDSDGLMAIELKCPRNGQIPETMFSACRDLQFLEQLIAHGFSAGLFLMHVDSVGFYGPGACSGIYAHFRGRQPIPSIVQKPTGSKDQIIELVGKYCVSWRHCGVKERYWLQLVKREHDKPCAL